MMEAGLSQAPAALGLASNAYGMLNQTLQAPVTTGTGVTNLLSAYRAPQADASALYGGALNLLSGAGTVNASQAYSTNAQVVGNAGALVQNQLQFGQQYSSQQYWNQMNYQQQVQAAQAAAAGAGTNWGALGGMALGGALGSFGGPMGAMAGAGIGAGVGGQLF
jgi:hypothetical protein